MNSSLGSITNTSSKYPMFVGRVGGAAVFVNEDKTLIVLNRSTRRRIAGNNSRARAAVSHRRESRKETRESWFFDKVRSTHGRKTVELS